ncbi:MAG TPA: alginate lyase family protein, partial [Rhizomicrobium sp.]
ESSFVAAARMNVSWYVRRLCAMGPREIAQRLADRLHESVWRRRYFATGAHPQTVAAERDFIGGLSRARAAGAPAEARDNLLCCAEKLLAGEWPIFAITRHDVTPGVDWHLDPRTGARAPADAYAFDISFVGGASEFDTKYVWELSRHHHTTVLALSYWLTGDERFAQAAAAQIESWIRANLFLGGIHWSSGIEIGLRLIAFAWTRRLLADWPRVSAHFDDNEEFARCVFQHQWVLAHRRSYGSSANNHLLYEMSGLYISACCMPWHAQAAEWRRRAAAILEREFARQIFADGYSREMASDYNGFVLEALLLCLVEGGMSGHPLRAGAWDCARRMFHWLGENSDCRGRPPRQGDSDDASGLLLDAPGYDRWGDLACFGECWFGRAPQNPESLRAWLLAPLAQPPTEAVAREADVSRPTESGLVILRGRCAVPQEIWCAFDAGPLGYLTIAAHGHADALAIELRYGGRPVLVDPGSYTYSGPWRDYFRSTAAHNTIELDGRSQSDSGGPFLWTRHARARLLCVEGLADSEPCARVTGEHDGYARLRFRGQHRRSVTLDRKRATLTICDELSAARGARVRMFYHLHPAIGCVLSGSSADLDCGGSRIRLKLPAQLAWRAVRGGKTPMLGWYSPSFGVRLPTTTLVGETSMAGALTLTTLANFPGA